MKKAEVSTSFLASVIIALVSGIFIFMVYSLMSGSVDVDRESCRTSVMLRSSAPEKYIFSAKDAIELSCKAKEICVSDNLILGGDCKNTLGEKYTNYKINKFDNNPEDKLKSLYAREIAECWNLMGRGEGQVFAGDSKSQNCVVCSIISLQDSVKEKVSSGLCYNSQVSGSVLDKAKCPNSPYFYYKEDNPVIWDFNRYLYTHKVPGQEVSYSKYIFDSDTTTQDFLDYLNSKEKGVPLFLDGIKAVIFRQDVVDTTSSSKWTKWGGLSGGVGGCALGATFGAKAGAVGGAFISSPFGGVLAIPGGILGGVWGCIKGATKGAVVVGGIGGTLANGNDAEFVSSVFITDYNVESLKEIGCTFESYS